MKLSSHEAELAKKAASRTESRTDKNPTTGADLGAGPGAGSTKRVDRKYRGASAELCGRRFPIRGVGEQPTPLS